MLYIVQAPDEKEVASAIAEGGQGDTDDEYIHDDDAYPSDMYVASNFSYIRYDESNGLWNMICYLKTCKHQ